MADLLDTLACHMNPPAKYQLDFAPLAEHVNRLSLLFRLEADDLSKAFHRVESLYLFDLLKLITSVLQISLFLNLSLLECANMVKCGPHDLLLDK